MHSKAFLGLALGIGCALGVANCGPVCPGGQQSCGSTNGSSAGAAGVAGAAGAAGATTCPQLTALEACLTAFCGTSGTGRDTLFCSCHDSGQDLSQGCACVPFYPDSFCTETAGVDPSAYADCGAVTSPLLTMCVGVQ